MPTYEEGKRQQDINVATAAREKAERAAINYGGISARGGSSTDPRSIRNYGQLTSFTGGDADTLSGISKARQTMWADTQAEALRTSQNREDLTISKLTKAQRLQDRLRAAKGLPPKGGGGVSGGGSNPYTDAWNSFDAQFSKAYGYLDQAGAGFAKLDSLGDEYGAQLEQYNLDFGGLKGDAIEGARGDIQAYGTLRDQLMESSAGDPERASTRAIADVRNIGRRMTEEESSRLEALGIDPTSGISGAARRKIGIGTSLQGAFAGDKARRGEKERATAAQTGLFRSIDPGRMAGVAGNIQSGENQLSQLRGGAISQAAAGRAGLAGQAENMASSYANTASSFARGGGVAGGGAMPTYAPTAPAAKRQGMTFG